MISAVAADLAARALGDLSGRRVLMVGAGRVAETTVRSLVRRGAGEVGVIDAGGLGRLAEELAAADIVVSSTDAGPVILGRSDVAAAMAGRRGRRLIVLDVSIPRDVDERVASVPGVTLLDVDDLARASVADAAAASAIAGLRARAEDVRRSELDRMRHRWEALTGADRERLEAVTRDIVDAILREPAARLRAAADAGDADLVARMRHLVGLEAPSRRPLRR